MLYKNAELFGVEQLLTNADGSVSFRRLPQNVYENLDGQQGRNMAEVATGIELRFRIKGERAIIKMSVPEGEGCFHVYRGAIQGGWPDHECHKCVSTTPEEFVIEHTENLSALRSMTQALESEWDPEIVRVILDRGSFKLFDIVGDIEPPSCADLPSKTLLCYGSSITHGSNSIDMSHAWPSVTAHNLRYDLLNKGMAGSCCMEPAFIDYIAECGQKNRWDMLVMELGINVLGWDEETIRTRAGYAIDKTATDNPDKPIVIISPFYHCGDTFDPNDRAKIWRKELEALVRSRAYSNVTYINGLDLLGDMTLISADLVHPNIYGVAQIAARLTERIKPLAK